MTAQTPGGTDPALALPPWLRAPLAETLARQRGHALLVHGASGAGVLPFALAWAQGLLCEDDDAAHRPCGRCVSCHLVGGRTHPDLFVLLPEALRQSLAWPLAGDKVEEGDGEGAKGRRKPSRQVRIDEVRALIDWVGRTGARGRGKVAVIHPGEAMNLQAASALLKTLEEPPAGTRLVLTADDPAHLLPTVRSRCQRVGLPVPARDESLAWLYAHGVAQPEVLLAAAGGHPLAARAMASEGIDAATWLAVPRAVAAGQGAAMASWPVPRVVDALHKLCHDAMLAAAGAAPRYFPAAALPALPPAALPALAAWSRRLAAVARHDEHPWHEGLLVDALVAEGREALAGGTNGAIKGGARPGARPGTGRSDKLSA